MNINIQKEEEASKYLQKLFEEHFTTLLTFSIGRFKLSTEQAEDIVQRTFIKVYELIHNDISKGIDYSEKFTMSYLLGILKREAYNFFGREKYRMKSEKEFSNTKLLTTEVELKNDLFSIIEEFLANNLSEKDLWIFTKRYKDQYSIEAIADELGMSKNAALVRLHRIKKKLREHFEEKQINLNN